MAEGDGIVYNEFKEKVAEGVVDLSSGADVIKLALFSVSYVPDIDSDVSFTALSNEVTGTGYTAGGETLANQDVTKDNTNDRGIYNADDVTWESLGILSPQPAWGVLYDDTHATKILIMYFPLETLTNGGDYVISWNTAGILTLT